jgi:hypothetical protein
VVTGLSRSGRLLVLEGIIIHGINAVGGSEAVLIAV